MAPQLPERRLRKHVLAGDLEGALALVHRARMPLREVLDSWIPAVSRDLGQAWQDDSIAWVDAARGHSCLDRLVRRLRPLGVADRGRVLVATLPGELHTLGSLLLAASLQLDGWEVTELREASVDALAEVVRAEGVHHLCISGHDLMALSADDVATLYGGGVSSILVGGAAAWSDRATELGVTWASTAARACARLRTRLPLGGRRRLVVAP